MIAAPTEEEDYDSSEDLKLIQHAAAAEREKNVGFLQFYSHWIEIFGKTGSSILGSRTTEET